MEQQGNLFVVQHSKNRSVFMDLMGVSEGKNKNLETFACGLLQDLLMAKGFRQQEAADILQEMGTETELEDGVSSWLRTEW